MSKLTVRRFDDERGAFIVVWALLVVGLLTMVAIVIDLGNARATRRSDQTNADFASLSAGDNLLTNLPQACADAWNYIKLNVDLPAGAGGPCTNFPSACANPDPTASPAVAGTAATDYTATNTGPYTITFRFPVADTDIQNATFVGQAGAEDGSPCQRFKVTVAKSNPSFFAGVVNRFGMTTTASAVMRTDGKPGAPIPSLWILDPTGCVALNSNGSSKVNVGSTANPGWISVDSNGTGASCSDKSPTIRSSNGQQSQINVLGNGQITLYALPAGSTCPSTPACGDPSTGISPAPTRAPSQITRAPADYAWNCKPTYQPALSIPSCPYTGTVHQAYIDTLKTDVGPSGTPGGFTLWTTWYNQTYPADTGSACNPQSDAKRGGPLVAPAGTNFRVDCSTGLAVSSNTTIEFQGNVVLDGPVSVKSGGVLTMHGNTSNSDLGACAGSPNSAGSGWRIAPDWSTTTCMGQSFYNPAANTGAAFVYMRSGDFDTGGGTTNFVHTALIEANGKVTASGNPAINWSPPTSGAFRKLSLWSENAADSSNPFDVHSSTSLTASGVFFMPNGYIQFGSSSSSNLTGAQIIAFDVEAKSSSEMTLVADASLNISPAFTKGVLIR